MASILVIDDEIAVRGMLKELLSRAGHAVQTAGNGTIGLTMACTGNFNVVITDLLMPEPDGFETIIALRRECPSLPVIAMTGAVQAAYGTTLDCLDTAAHLGAGCVLRKPFTRDALLQAINTVLQARNYKFLVLDDDERHRDLHAMRLRRAFAGCSVVECESAAEAVEQSRAASLDAVIADHHLRGTDGIQFMRDLRSAEVRCPVVMVTNSNDPSVRESALAAGVSGVFGPDDGPFLDHLRRLVEPPGPPSPPA